MSIPEKQTLEQSEAGILKSLPRRSTQEFPQGTATLSQMRFLEFNYSRFTAFRRLLSLISLVLSYFTASAFNILRRKNSPEARAKILRRAFERRGGAITRLGIHLSMRVDLLPWAFGVELSKMTDHMAPFPIEQAIEIVERAVKMPLAAVFSQFDPKPIASTATSCIYQAKFHNQEPVIVKVRRPGAGAEFMADLKAFSWLLKIAEFLTIFKPGFTDRLYYDSQNYLLKELDFVEEARRQDAFRRSAAAINKKPFFSAPKVHLDLSNEEVVVEEFISGLWLNELIHAVEKNDENLLQRAEALNIRPKKVAQRLMWVHFWSLDDNLFFIADPHPNNIIIGENSCIYYVNFADTGTLSRSKRQAVQQMRYYIEKQDPQNMARAQMVLLEPLPPVDILELTAELESFNWQHLFALDAAPVSLTWHERTSAVQWIGMLDVAKRHSIIIETQVLQLLKASLINESSAIRLCHELDIMRVHRKFENYRAEQARRRITDGILDQLDGEVNERLIIRMDRIAYTLQGLFFRTRHMLTMPAVNFTTLIGKGSYSMYILFRTGFQLILLTAVAALLVFGLNWQEIQPAEALQILINHPVYQVLALLLLFINGRSVLFRLEDMDA